MKTIAYLKKSLFGQENDIYRLLLGQNQGLWRHFSDRMSPCLGGAFQLPKKGDLACLVSLFHNPGRKRVFQTELSEGLKVMIVVVLVKLRGLRFMLLRLNVDSRMILKEGPGNLRKVAIRVGRKFMALVLELVKDNITCPLWRRPSSHQGVRVIGNNDGS